MPEPLTRADLARLEQIGARLQSQFGAVLRTLPPSAQTIRGLASLLDADRNICHRLLTACASTRLPIEVVERAPGIKGLRQLVEAFRRIRIGHAHLEGIEVTLDRYEEILRSVGSRNRLLARLAATREDATDVTVDTTRTVEARRQRYSADAALLGTSHELQLRIAVFRRDPADPDKLEAGLVVGSTGTVSQPDGTPLLLHVFQASRDQVVARSLDDTPIEATIAPAILTDFSTHPLPQLTAIEDGRKVLQIIEPAALPTTGSMDLMIGMRFRPFSPHPRLLDPAMLTQVTRLRIPSRFLHHEVFIERDLARESIPSLGCYLQSEVPFDSFHQNWHSRLPLDASLQIHPGGEAPGCAWYRRHASLRSVLFEKMGWSMADFVCHGYSQIFPLSGADYVVGFDFSRSVET